MPSEEQWQREADARTLAEAEEIKGDAQRYAGAKAEAARKADEMNKVAEGEAPAVPQAQYGYPGK